MHDEQFMPDEGGQEYRLAGLDLAHLPGARRQGQFASAAHLVPAVLRGRDDEHAVALLDVEAMSRCRAHRVQKVLRGHPAAASGESHSQQ